MAADDLKVKLRCMHDGVELAAARVEFSPRPHVVLEFTLKVGRAAAGTLYVDSANINPMLAASEHVADLNTALSAFKDAMERIFLKHQGVMTGAPDVDEEPQDPIEV